MRRRIDLLIGFAIALFVFVFWYLPHTAPTVLAERDSAEFQVLGYYLGIPHGTGYPVYIWLLKLFSFLPVGDVAYRANLLSAVLASAAAGVTYGVALTALMPRVGTAIRRAGAATGALTAAYTFTLWSQAIRAEVYALHALLCMAILFLVLRWGRGGGFGNLVVAAGLWAVGLGHHRQIVALVPPVLAYLLVGNRAWMTRKRVAILACTIAAGVAMDVGLFYILWLRDLPFDQFHRNILGAADIHGASAEQLRGFWHAFWFQTSGRQFSSLMFSARPSEQIHMLLLVPFRVLSEYFLIGSILVAAGFLNAWKDWRTQILFVVWAMTQIYININYTTLGVEVYYISVFLACGIWLAEGTTIILAPLAELPSSRLRIFLFVAIPLTILFMNPYSGNGFIRKFPQWFAREGPYMAVAAGTRPGLEGSYLAQQQGRAFVSAVPSNSLVYGPWQFQFVVEYVARIERGITTLDYYERSPLSRFDQVFSKLYMQNIDAQVRTRPVLFVGIPPKEIQARFKVRNLGRGLFQILPQ